MWAIHLLAPSSLEIQPQPYDLFAIYVHDNTDLSAEAGFLARVWWFIRFPGQGD